MLNIAWQHVQHYLQFFLINRLDHKTFVVRHKEETPTFAGASATFVSLITVCMGAK